MSFTDIISSADLTAQLERAVILDCRAKLGDSTWGKNAYNTGHIPGAIYANLDEDLAAPPGSQGRHPLPERDNWLQTVRKWGIKNGQQVIAYDDAGGAYAARAWWMLRWLGHASVAVLDGGLASYTDPLQTGPNTDPEPAPSDFSPDQPITKIITTQALLEDVLAEREMTLVDARVQTRWAGIEEPIDPKAGHIPGAVCLPFQDNLHADGHFRDAQELRARFAQLTARTDQIDAASDVTVVCYCGSGVTAAHNILAMRIAGMAEPTLYADSWSGWITAENRPVSTAT